MQGVFVIDRTFYRELIRSIGYRATSLYVWLLCEAKSERCLEGGEQLNPGQIIIRVRSLADTLQQSEQILRTDIQQLVDFGLVKKYSKLRGFSIITLLNYQNMRERSLERSLEPTQLLDKSGYKDESQNSNNADNNAGERSFERREKRSSISPQTIDSTANIQDMSNNDNAGNNAVHNARETYHKDEKENEKQPPLITTPAFDVEAFKQGLKDKLNV